MPNIIHRIGIPNAALSDVYNTISTKDGVAAWWTSTINGYYEEGNILEFRFGEGGPDFRIMILEPDRKVVWKCIAGPPEWIDTQIEFTVKMLEKEVVLLFKHGGWKKEVEFMHHCSTQWAYFLIGLRDDLAGTGKPTPFGSKNFKPISNWSK